MKEYPILVALMANLDITQRNLAKTIGKDLSTANRKLNEGRFDLEEAKKITSKINELDSNNTWTVDDVFFSDLVAKVQHKAS